MAKQRTKQAKLKPQETLGTIVRPKKPEKHEYEMKRTVKWKDEIYRCGEKVRLTGQLLKIFIRNGYIK